MRETSYRGKDKTKEWVYGFFSKIIPAFDADESICIISNHEGKYAVEPETVGQYIGLTDKNGNKIFEGDILDCGKFIGVVEYNKIIAAFVVRINDSTDTFYHWSLLNEGNVDRKEQLQYTEVIGNIHDNPELLEVKENG